MKKNLRSIKDANIAIRILAMIMDGVISAFVWAGLASWVMKPIADSAFNYTYLLADTTKYQVFSKLYVYEIEDPETGEKQVAEIDSSSLPEGNESIISLVSYESNDLNFYKERIHYYYTCYKTGENVTYPEGKNPEDFKAPNYNEKINIDGNLVLPREYYTETWFETNFGSINDLEGIKNAVKKASEDLVEQSFFKDANHKIENIQLFIILPPYVFSFGIFYFLFPLIFKNGETLGKKVMHIGFVTKDEYDIKKRQIIFRQSLLFVYISLFAFVYSISYASLAFIGLAVFIYLIATIIPKSKRSPADFAAFTKLIDTKQSVWFKDPEEEAQKEADVEAKMEKYSHYEPEQKHVIQVGSKIVDENVLREINEEKNKKAKK